MGDLATRANGKDPSVINGNLKTTFRRVTGCNKLDREIARKNVNNPRLKSQACKSFY